MALFQRIFSPTNSLKNISKERKCESQKTVTPKLDRSKIRLVISADTERGRMPYFDSNAIRLVEETDKDVTRTAPKAVRSKAFFNSGQRDSSASQHKQTHKYHFQKLGNDVKVLEEMMYGTVAMAFKGLSVKVHLLRWAKRSPSQLMVSNVFVPRKPSRDCSMDLESDSNSLTGFSSGFSSLDSLPVVTSIEKYARSIPVDVPTRDLLSDHSTEDDSGLAYFTSSGNLRTSLPSPSNGSMSSYSSLHRRWMRAQSTSLNGHYSKYSASACESLQSRPQRNRLAVGIIFGSHDDKDKENNELFQSFFFSHFALIEGHVEKLRCVVEKAYFNSRSFLPAVMEALDTFRNDIFDLYTAPRLPEPVWLTMISATTYKTKLCERFMETFTWLVTKCDNNNCKFFVSTLLSAVLTQHLAWVATVTPAGGTPTNTYLDKHIAKWVDTLTKSHPYNPLWAQLGDLIGAIGFPRKISRTVVIGKKAEIVKRFLYILSYFIRCSEVQENTDIQCLSNIINDTHFESSLSPVENTLDGLEGSSTATENDSTLDKKNSSNIQSVNGFANNKVSEGNSQCKQSQLFHPQTEEKGSDYLKHSNEPVTSFMMESTVHRQNYAHLEISDGGYSCTHSESGCKQELEVLNSTCTNNIPFVRESVSEICKCDTINTVSYETNNILCQTHQKLSPINSDSYKSNHLSEAKVLSNSNDSSYKSLVQGISSTSPAVDCMGMSELYIYVPDSTSPCSVTSGKVLNFQMEQSCLANRELPNTKCIGEGFNAGAESVSKSQSSSEGKFKSRLTQQLGEDFNELNVAGKRRMISVGSPALLPSENKIGIDSINKLYLPKQTSQDSRTPPERSISLAKIRSMPTELNRRRHLSSTGSIDYETFDPTFHCKEIRIPDPVTGSGQWHVQDFDRNFGHSLLADYNDHYMSDFVLHGTSDTNFKSRLLNDLQMSVRHSVLDEPIDEAVCVIADTDNWTVEVASSKVMGISPSGCTMWTASKLVADLIKSVVENFKLKMSAEFCLMHLEDKLQEIFFKSVLLSENLRAAATYSQQELNDILGCNSSDMPLLRAIAGTQPPSFVY